jgi:hypothetical protein
MTEQIRGTESGMPASRFEVNVCYLGLTPKPAVGGVYRVMARGDGESNDPI